MLALEGDRQIVTEAFELCESAKDEAQIPEPRINPAVREPENAPKRRWGTPSSPGLAL